MGAVQSYISDIQWLGQEYLPRGCRLCTGRERHGRTPVHSCRRSATSSQQRRAARLDPDGASQFLFVPTQPIRIAQTQQSRSSCGESPSVVVPSEQKATVSDHDELVDSRIPIDESDRESTVTGPVFSGDDSGGIDIEDQYAFDSAEVTALTAVSEQQQLSVPSEFSLNMTPPSNTPRNMTPRRGSTGSVFRRRMHTPPPARRSLNGAPTTNQAGLSSDDDKTSPCKIGDASPPTRRSFGDVQRPMLHSDDDEKTSPRKIGGA